MRNPARWPACTLGVKDIFDVAGYATGCGNPRQARRGATLPQQTAPAVQALLDAGARFVGKTQTDELAFSLMGQNAHFPLPVNPAAPDRVTGGSSSGSAAAVAGGLADIAVGSDTGGSIRAPASFCGLIGLRTTHGRISLEGAMPLAPCLDTFGWFADDIETYEAVGRSPARPPIAHRTQLNRAASPSAGSTRCVARRRPRPTAYDRSEGDRAAAVRLSRRWSAAASPRSLDELYWCLRRLQALRSLAARMAPGSRRRARRFGPASSERFDSARPSIAATAEAEQARRAAFRAELARLLGNDGVLVLPTVPGAAPLATARREQLQAYRERALRLLCLSGLSGFPQITLPLGTVDGAPFGISLLGPPDSDIAPDPARPPAFSKPRAKGLSRWTR